MNKKDRAVITEVLELYLNHRLVDSLVDQISDRFADIDSQAENEIFESHQPWKTPDLVIKKTDDRLFINSKDPLIKRYIADNNPEYQTVEED